MRSSESTRRSSSGFGQQQDLADREAVGAVLAVEHVAPGGAVDGGGLEQLPAVEDGLGVDPRGAPAGGPDPELQVRGLAVHGPADAAEQGAADHARAHLQPAQAHVLGVGAEGLGEVVAVGLEAALAAQLGVEQLLEAAGLTRALGVGVGEQALLDRDRGLRRLALGPGLRLALAGAAESESSRSGWRPADAAESGLGVRVVGRDRLGHALRVGGVLLGHGVVLGGLSRGRCSGSGCRRRPGGRCSGRVCRLCADLLDLAVVGGDDRGALLGVDLDGAAVVVGLDHVGGVLAGLDALERLLLLEVVGVAGAGGDGEAALGQPGQRPDEVGGDAGDQPGAQHHRVDVPVGVVVGKDRPAHVLLIAGGLQIARGGEDRVDGVVGVLLAVLVRIDPIGPPRRGDELHPPQRTGGGDVQVAPVVGLDLVDRRQDLPPHPVLDPRRLIDRQQEHRHPELPNHEIRHTRRERRTRQRIHEARVALGGRTVRVAQRGVPGPAPLATLTLDLSLRVGVIASGCGGACARRRRRAPSCRRAAARSRPAGLGAGSSPCGWLGRGVGRRRLGRGRGVGSGWLGVPGGTGTPGSSMSSSGRAGRDVDGDRDHAAVGELHGHVAQLSGRGHRERRDARDRDQPCAEQEIRKPLLHP